MSQRRSSILLRVMSPTSMNRKFSILPVASTESEISTLSFKHWHKRMQHDHEMLAGKTFQQWKWCRTGCKPCRWFDSIDYDKKICKCCLKFRTFKALGTLVLIAVFFYIFMYSILNKELLPGGTVFFIFLLCLTAYLVGHVLMYAGLPSMIGHLIVGLAFGNLPPDWLPEHDREFLLKVARILEKIILLIALIRAGLLLDLAQIKNRIMFILRISLFPLLAEFFVVWVTGHFLLQLPWDWSALQGSVLCIVSLAHVTSAMEKNRQTGYGEDKNLSTVLIAASALCVVLGLFLYIACVFVVFPSEGYNKKKGGEWKILLNILEQFLIGLMVGAVAGLLISFFPDKRNSEAAVWRIVVTGIGSLALGNILNESEMTGACVLGTITMCIVATNMWEEMGWHQSTNPVLYFYTLLFYFSQPAALSLVGFTMNFHESDAKQIGLSIAVIIIGLIGRESVCFASTLGPLYPTTTKEKIYICIAWFSKGTFPALLAFAIDYLTSLNEQYLDKDAMNNFLGYTRCIKQTIILAILLTTPLACYGITLLTPILLTKKDRSSPTRPPPNDSTPAPPGNNVTFQIRAEEKIGETRSKERKKKEPDGNS